MDKFKDDIAFVLDQSGIYKASLHAQEEMTEAEICGTNVDTLVHQACDERARLLRAMQCSGAMFDTNMQCVAYILSLKKENMIQKRNYDAEKEVHTCYNCNGANLDDCMSLYIRTDLNRTDFNLLICCNRY